MDKCNTTQSKDNFLTIYIMGGWMNQIRELREWKIERVREREIFLSYSMIYIIGDVKPFYTLFKLLSLIFLLININGSHK